MTTYPQLTPAYPLGSSMGRAQNFDRERPDREKQSTL
jgi:hypothetical protein